jgi:hypothetical protein
METSPNLIGTCILSQPVSANDIAGELEGVPTVLQVTENYMIIAMSNGEIQVFDIHDTRKQALSSSRGAVWALAENTSKHYKDTHPLFTFLRS